MKRLKSLDAWRVSKELALATYRLTLRKPLAQHPVLARQIQRAATAIPANIAEGYGLGTRAQLIRCVRIALGSAMELELYFELTAELGILGTNESPLSDSDRVISILIGLLKRLGARVPR